MSAYDRCNVTRRKFMKDISITAATAGLAAGIFPIFPSSAEAQENPRLWFKKIYRMLHTDAHHGRFKVIYKDFDAEATAQAYQDAGFQLVSYITQDGPSYYPTKIGLTHPGLQCDYVGELTRALKKRGIKTVAYISAQGDHINYEKHPDWVYNPDPAREVIDTSTTRSRSTMCLNSPWVDEVFIPQCKEILDLYDVDGFFPDGVLRPLDAQHCYCKYCRESFGKEVGGKMPTKEGDPKTFEYRKWSNRRIIEYLDKVYQALSAIKPGIALINNYAWMSRFPITPPDYVMHVCWDTPVPDGGLNRMGLYALNFSIEARYLSTLLDIRPNLTYSCMNVSSLNWGDYQLRETETYLQEAATVEAGGGRIYLSFNPYPSGNPAPAVIEAYSTVNKRTTELEPVLKDSKPVKDVAVLHSADSIWSRAGFNPSPEWIAGPPYYPVCGAHKALIEGHVQMGILNSEVFIETIDQYRAIVLPNQRVLSRRECDAVRRFVKNGGALIATGETGTRDSSNKPLDTFSLNDVLGVDYIDTVETSMSYIRVSSKIESFGIAAYDYPVVGQYSRVKTTTAKTLLELVPPYEGITRGNPPPAIEAEGPGVTINSYGKGKAIYCSSALFSAYYEHGVPVLRKLGLWILDQVYPQSSRSIILENTPINVEVFYNERGDERFVHLVNYSGDKREIKISMTQDFVVVHDIRVKVRLNNRPRMINTVPDEKQVAFTYKDGWATFEAEPLEIHSVYMIEI